jgi:hypothetical protein
LKLAGWRRDRDQDRRREIRERLRFLVDVGLTI